MTRVPERAVPLGLLPVRTAFVGRARELAFLKQQYDEIADGHGGRLVLIGGEPGVGKTRLALEAGHYARENGGRFLEGTHLRDGTAPYGAWVDALRKELGGHGKTDLAALTEAYGTELARLWPQTESIGAQPAAEPTIPEDQRRRLFDAVVLLLERLARRQPLLLLLNDLQWDPSPALLSHVARRLAETRVLLVGTYREGEIREHAALRREWAELNRARLAAQVRLRPFDEAEVKQLIANLLGVEPAEQLRTPLYRQTRGNAFFLEEVVHSLVEVGAVQPQATGWKVLDPTRLVIPDSIRLVVEERVVRLGELGQEVLTQAAVLGQGLRFDALQRLSGRSEDELLAVLAQALGARLLIDRSVSGEERYGFAEDQVQEVLYDGLAAPWRRRLHLRAGQVLETLYTSKVEEHADELAHHFGLGNERDKALQYAQLAAERAFRLGSWERAAQHFEAVVTLAGPDESRRLTALERLIEIDTLLARPGLRFVDEALALYAKLGERRRAARLHRAASIRWSSGAAGRVDWQRSQAHLEAAAALLELEPESPEKAYVSSGLTSNLLFSRLDLDAAVAQGRAAVACAEQLGDRGQTGYAGGFLSVALAWRGEIDEAKQVARRAWEEVRSGADHPYLTAAVAFLLGPVWPWLQDRSWVEWWLESCWQQLDRLHVERYNRPIAGFLALIAALRGEPDEAARWLRRCDEEASRHPTLWPYLDCFRGAALGLLGRSAEADHHLGASLAAGRGSYGRLFEVEGAIHYGRHLLRIGQTSPAAGIIEDARAIARAQESPVQELQLLVLRCSHALAVGQFGQAAQRLQQAQALSTRLGSAPGLRTCVLECEAKRHAAVQNWTEAERALEEAWLTERRHGFRLTEARLLLPWIETLLARNAAGDRERTLALCDEAISHFETCGAADELERARSQRERALAGRAATRGRREPPQSAAWRSVGLTEREQDVAELVVRGFTNRQVAERLVITEGTVRTHVDHVLGKLGLSSRTQLAAWAAERGLIGPQQAIN
ncbi:MAG: AAA family ATPase [Chloroflexi bacterium]|nr:AAA family ATPase [Chloroflexota bacterium]